MTDYRLLDAYLRLHATGPEWGEARLTNHGPMVAEVLVRRGEGDRLPGWIDRYVTRLDELPRSSTPVDDGNWRTALGDDRRCVDWTRFFTGQLTDRPWREVLIRWWPRLLPGIAAGTTHGVIRVGHAVRALLADDRASSPLVLELASALAFWAANFRRVPGAAGPAGGADPATALAGLPVLDSDGGSVADRLARLPRTPGWTGRMAALRPPADPADAAELLAGLVAAGTVQYLRSGPASPILLVHAATAPNAILHTLPALPSELWIRSLHAAWSATAAISSAYRGVSDRPPAAGDTADELFARAAEHGDEHVIKFTDTALDVFERTGDPRAPAAAALAAQLIDRP